MKASGADDPHEVHGVHECRIALKNLLELGDGIALNYVSEGQQSKKQAQKAAFVEVLSYILFRGPKHLRTHVSQWRTDLLKAVRRDAEVGLRGRLGPRPRGQWSPLSEPADAPETRRTSAHSSRSAYVAPADGEDPAERDARVLEALRLVPQSRDNRGELPPAVWPVLARELPQGGLLPFLQRFPDEFTIVSASPLVWRRL